MDLRIPILVSRYPKLTFFQLNTDHLEIVWMLGVQQEVKVQLTRIKPTACLLAILILISGCSVTQPPVIDVPASDLDVKITILDTQLDYKDIPVTMQFLRNGTLVQFGNNARVFCDGKELMFNGLAYIGRVPRHAIGHMYNFSYFHNGIAALEIAAQKRPIITSPAAYSTIVRTYNLTIAYIAETSSGVRGTASDGSSAVGGNPDFQPDNGSYGGIDISTLKAGSGSLELTREYEGVVSNTPFRSIVYIYDSAAEISVTFN